MIGLFNSSPPLPTAPTGFLTSHGLISSITSFPSNLPKAYDLDTLVKWYNSADPLHPAILFASVVSVIVWILGEITGNVSQVDRLWTFLPMVYSVHFTFYPKWSGNGTGKVDDRMFLVFLLQCAWSARLTTNTYRRGFFNPKSEDYRWPYVRDRIPVWAFKIMNFFFIAFAQNYLLLIAELPLYVLLSHCLSASYIAIPRPLSLVDWELSALFLLTLTIEMLSDNQQQTYQNLKHNAKSLELKGDKGGGIPDEKQQGRIKRGFVTEGLWSWSRHPNFACEQTTWYILYAFTVLPFLPSSLTLSHIYPFYRHFSSLSSTWYLLKKTEGLLWNYSVLSPLSMSGLFYSSTWLTEIISSEKYPLYKSYQKRVGQFWPPITILKAIFLFVTGQLGKVNNDVYGSAASVKSFGGKKGGALVEKKRQ